MIKTQTQRENPKPEFLKWGGSCLSSFGALKRIFIGFGEGSGEECPRPVPNIYIHIDILYSYIVCWVNILPKYSPQVFEHKIVKSLTE
jgi:hypothetical protein